MIVNELLKFYKNPLIKFLDKGPDPRNYKVNFSRVKETFNFIPKYTLEDGILEIKDYLKSKKNNFTDCGNYLIDNEK